MRNSSPPNQQYPQSSFTARNAYGRMKDDQGAVMVEFALILPLLLFIYLGMVEFNHLYSAKSKFENMVSSIVDLVSRQEHFDSKRDVEELLKAGKTLIAPFPTDDLSLKVADIRLGAGSAANVTWSAGINNPGWRSSTSLDLPALAELERLSDHLVYATARYKHRTILGNLIPNGLLPAEIEFTSSRYAVPRYSEKITLGRH